MIMSEQIHRNLLPLQNLVPVANLRPDGLAVMVTATPAQRTEIALMLGLPSVEELKGNFTLTPAKRGLLLVTGTVTASIHQTCVVTLDAFETSVNEQVELEFIPADKAVPTMQSVAKPTPEQEMEDNDPPDLIIDGHIDLGAVTVEFLALGLDPFPRKPDAEFNYVDPADEKENPFAKLIKLKRD